MPASARNFYGQRLQAAELSGLRITASLYAGGLLTPRHHHEFAYLGLVLDGASEQRVGGGVGGGQLRRAEAGDLVFHPPGEWHTDHFLAPRTRLFQIEVLPERLQQLPADRPQPPPAASVRSRRCQWLAAAVLQELQHPDAATPLAVEGLSLELLSTFWRESRRPRQPLPPPWVRRAREILRDRFADCLSLSEVAAAVGVSDTHLARAYRRFYHCSLGEDLRRFRVEFACSQLSSTQRPLAQIAAAAGFCDQAHFCRTFQRALAISPGKYRREHNC